MQKDSNLEGTTEERHVIDTLTRTTPTTALDGSSRTYICLPTLSDVVTKYSPTSRLPAERFINLRLRHMP